MKHDYGYTEQNRLLNLFVSWGDRTLLRGYGYVLGASGQRLAVVETHRPNTTLVNRRSVNYYYDLDLHSSAPVPRLYRLGQERPFDGAAAAVGRVSAGYDRAGNRSQRTVEQALSPAPVETIGAQTFAFDAQDRIDPDTDPNNANFNYDANGNIVAQNGVMTADQYDQENRLLKRGTTVTLAYDHDGNRVSKTVGGTTTYYLVDDRNPTGYAQVVAEFTSLSGAPLVTYTYGLDLISQNRAGTVHYYGYDGLGSVRHLTDAGLNAATVLSDSYDYDAWGLLLATTSTTVNTYRYTGEQWDSDLGLYYLRARYYRPDLGRFWNKDSYAGSQSDPASLHKYLYAGDDPVNHIDPSGHETLPSLMTGFTIHAIGFRMLVGGAVGVWDANFRGYSAWDGLTYGALGGAAGPIIPWQLQVTLTAYGIGEALEDGNYESALFRGAVAVVGAGSWRWSKSLLGGRLGNLNTQLQNSKLALYLKGKGWTIRSGGGMGPEERIPPPGGGRDGETWVDITAVKNGRVLRVQTVDTQANGTPTPRELNAASRIRNAFPSDKVLLVPKENAGGSGSTTPPLFKGPEDEP